MKVVCTWGDGPDILMDLDGTPVMAYENPVNVSEGRGLLKDIPKDDVKLCWGTHGFIRKGSIDLTKDQALRLAEDLIVAAAQCQNLEDSIPGEKDEKTADEQIDKERT